MAAMNRDAEGAARAFGAYLRNQRQLARLSLRELATKSRISNPYLSQLERGLHVPSVNVIRALADALQLSAEVLLAEAAGLERVSGGHHGNGRGVEAAIRTDQQLSSAQKAALLAVYRSMIDQATNANRVQVKPRS
jgi:transcriptional regulator with XRE-family HTH domain